MGIINKRVPNSASDSPKLVLILGIRLAQVANPKPWPKKNNATAMRMRCFCCREYAESVLNELITLIFQQN